MKPAEWTECRAVSGAVYWMHRSGDFAVGPDECGGFKVRKKTGQDWTDLARFPDAASAKQSVQPQQWEVTLRQPDRGDNTVPAVGDQLVIGRAETLPTGKTRVFMGRRIEHADSGQFAIVEWTPGGWVERGRFDTLEAAEEARREPRLLAP